MSPGKRRGRKPAVADEDRLADAVARCRETIERGETVDVDELVRGSDASSARLREQLVALLHLDDALGAALARDVAAPVPVGTALGAYRLQRIVGAGGMGTVYLASVEGTSPAAKTGDRVAVKVVHPHLVARRGYLERFRREAELGLRVRHPNVVRTLDAGETRGDGGRWAWLVMEFVEGRTLAELMHEQGAASEPLCRHVGHEVSAALEAIHAAGAVHRDVKPDNVLVSAGDVVQLMDLGVARPQFDATTLSQTGAFIGSMLYAAPEQFGAAGADARTDLHAVGLLLYEMATGVHPYASDSPVDVVRRIHDERPRPAGDVVPALSPFFEELVATLLAKDPRERLASAAELRTTLELGEASEFWGRRAAAARRTSHRLIRRQRASGEPRCVGRDTETERLVDAFTRAASGAGGTVLVTGEAGIGKSRLADELADQLAAGRTEFDVLFVGHAPFDGGDAFIDALRAHLRGATSDDDLRELLPATRRLVAPFGALLRGEPPPERAPRLTPDSLQTLFVHAVRGLAARRPVVLWVDDLHFAPSEARALFSALARAVAGHRVLLVGTTRPVADDALAAELSRRSDVTRIDLARLGVKDLVLLLRDLLGSTALAEELAGRVGVKSDGNPYFALEIVRTLKEEGLLARKEDGRWRTTQAITEIKVPSSVQDLVALRLSGLAREDRNLLDAAACAGFRFDPTLVGDALGLARIAALQRFAAIQAACGIVRSAGRDYEFDHHQAQEVIHAGIHEVLREEYHAAIGAAIETRSGAAGREPKDLDGDLCVEITSHFVSGGQGRRALRYVSAALDHLERRTRPDALGRLTRRVLAVPGLVDGAARVKVLLHNANGLGREFSEAEREANLKEAVAIAKASGDSYLRCRAHQIYGLHLERQSRYLEAEATLRAALRFARATQDRVRAAESTTNLGLVAYRMGRMAAALELHQSAREEAIETGRRDVVGACDGNLGMVLNTLGRTEEAKACFESQLAIGGEIGEPRFEVAATGNLALCAARLGRLADCVALNRRCLELAREIGYRQSEAIALDNIGDNFASLGSVEEAEDALERSLVLAREIGFRLLEIAALGQLGQLAADRGDDATARARFEETVNQCDTHGLGAEQAAAGRLGLAEIAERAGRHDEARSLFERVLADEAASTSYGTRFSATAGLARLSAREPHELVRVFDEMVATMGIQERLSAHFAVWRTCKDAAHLADAKSLLDHLVEHAPAQYRESMLTRVPLHRRIVEAVASA